MPTPRTLDVCAFSRPTYPLSWLVIGCAVLLSNVRPVGARTLALISPPTASPSRADQNRRLQEALRLQLRSLGIRVAAEADFGAAARRLDLDSRTALHQERLLGLCAELDLDGVLIVGSQRRGRMTRLSAFLFDAGGHLVLRRQRHQRSAAVSRRWLRDLALSVERRLLPARPPLENPPEIGLAEAPPPSVDLRAAADAPPEQAPGGPGWQPAVELGVEGLGTSNLFSDASRVADLGLHPWLDLGVDLAGDWALGYRAELQSWLRREDLLQHAHRLYAAKGFNWGQRGQVGLILLADVAGSFNREAYRALDFLDVRLRAVLEAGVLDWLTLRAAGGLGGRAFFHDEGSNSLDAELQAGLVFRLPARWQLRVEGRGDGRLYVQSPAGTGEADDLQVGGGLHLTGPLWRQASLVLDAGYRLAIGDSHQVQRILAEAQVRALGDAYLSSGPRAGLRITQALGERIRVATGVRFEQNAYAGWPALDGQGQPLGHDRQDRRLGPEVAIAYRWSAEELPFGASLRLEYGFTRQWSNGPWTDTSIHLLGLQLMGTW